MNANDQRLLGAELLGIIRRDRVRRSRGRQFGAFLGKLFTTLLTGFLTALVAGWMFMLAVAVMHEHWIPGLPTIGFWWAVLVAGLLRSAVFTTGSAKSGGTS